METIFKAVRRVNLGRLRRARSAGHLCRVSKESNNADAQANVHRMHHDASRIQLCTLMNIKSEIFHLETSNREPSDMSSRWLF